MGIYTGDFLRNTIEEHKSKVVQEVITTAKGTIIIVYKFWNQVGNKERVSTLEHLLKTHNLETNLHLKRKDDEEYWSS